MTGLPDHYPSPLDLPFNAACLQGNFELLCPDRSPDVEKGLWIILQEGSLVVADTGESLDLPEGSAPTFLAEPQVPPLFLGRWKGRPCFTARVKSDLPLPAGYAAEDLLASQPRISIDLLTLAGIAGQALHWEKNSRACSRCGSALERIAGNWGKRCQRCSYDHYPHIHSCVIVLVRRQGEVLLTRKAQWPESRYSLVAGFVDFGECLEEAVVREVREETGVEIENVRYVGSQAWPFPSQLMAGFVADWAGGEVTVEEEELEDARWFALDKLPNLPPRRSIARYIIDRHLQEVQGA